MKENDVFSFDFFDLICNFDLDSSWDHFINTISTKYTYIKQPDSNDDDFSSRFWFFTIEH